MAFKGEDEEIYDALSIGFLSKYISGCGNSFFFGFLASFVPWGLNLNSLHQIFMLPFQLWTVGAVVVEKLHDCNWLPRTCVRQ